MSKLKCKREQRKLSQRQLADYSDVNIRVIQTYEQGQRKIDNANIKTLCKLATTLRCCVSELIEDDELAELIRTIMF